MNMNGEARNVLVAAFEDEAKNLKLPGNVGFALEENATQCRIKLNSKKVQTENMQTDANAFEAWAIAFHVALAKMGKTGKIILDVDDEFKNIPYETNGHWGRFLYRAMRFSEQYGAWFKLSESVEGDVNTFKRYLAGKYFTNNLPKGEAGTKKDHNDENVVEAKLAEADELYKILAPFDLGNNKVYRQLPVGLFKIAEGEIEKGKPYKCSNEARIFTGGKSAIDLWTWNKDEFEVIELKIKNVMVGIITEIFFYSNYMYDFLVRQDAEMKGKFVLNGYKNIKKDDRGYSNISTDKFKKVSGIMLADEYHPILKDKWQKDVMSVLNERVGVEINYVKADYKCTIDVSKVEG